jgi:hypothetical protein
MAALMIRGIRMRSRFPGPDQAKVKSQDIGSVLVKAAHLVFDAAAFIFRK